MRTINRLTLVGLVTAAAVAVGSAVLMAPASAALPQPVGGAAFEVYSVAAQASDQSDGKWKGGAARDMETGTWRATVTRGDLTILLGQYETEKEAKKAGREKARELNGVMDGPGCDPPFVLC